MWRTVSVSYALQVLQYPWLTASETELNSGVFACALNNLLLLHALDVVHGDVRLSNLVLHGRAACGCSIAGAASDHKSRDNGSPHADRVSKRLRADTSHGVGTSAAPLVQACPRAVFIDFDWSGRARSPYRCFLAEVDDGKRHKDAMVEKPMQAEHDFYALAAVMELFTVAENHSPRWLKMQECTSRGEISKDQYPEFPIFGPSTRGTRDTRGTAGTAGTAGTGSPVRLISAPSRSMKVSCDWRSRGTHGPG